MYDANMLCANGDKRPVVGERTIGIVMDDSAPDGFWEQVELLCAECLIENA